MASHGRTKNDNMSRGTPFILPYEGAFPAFATAPIHVGSGAAVLGRATIGGGAWLGAGSVVRADGHYVSIGADFRLGARGTVHIAHDFLATHVGDGVTAGVNAVIHACDVGDRCHIGRDVVILDGAKVADGLALADGSIVFPRSVLEAGWLYRGQPAKPVRRLEPGELEALHAASRSEPDEAVPARREGTVEAEPPFFLAATASTSGRILAGPDVGIWFGCDLDAGSHEISIGRNTNVQDNTIIRCERRPVVIGTESTIGHNVFLSDCIVGNGSLIGIGAVVAAGTVVEDEVLLAAGGRTVEGQRLDGGWLYGGNPAKKLAPLDDKKRAIIAATWPTYRIYARHFDESQQEPAQPGEVT
jgi:gamma-carbonic anhydrase